MTLKCLVNGMLECFTKIIIPKTEVSIIFWDFLLVVLISGAIKSVMDLKKTLDSCADMTLEKLTQEQGSTNHSIGLVCLVVKFWRDRMVQ